MEVNRIRTRAPLWYASSFTCFLPLPLLCLCISLAPSRHCDASPNMPRCSAPTTPHHAPAPPLPATQLRSSVASLCSLRPPSLHSPCFVALVKPQPLHYGVVTLCVVMPISCAICLPNPSHHYCFCAVVPLCCPSPHRLCALRSRVPHRRGLLLLCSGPDWPPHRSFPLMSYGIYFSRLLFLHTSCCR